MEEEVEGKHVYNQRKHGIALSVPAGHLHTYIHSCVF